MTPRLTSRMLVGALVRAAQAQGGTAMVLHRGEETAGTILVQLSDRGTNLGFAERMTGLSGVAELVPCGPAQSSQISEIQAYIERRTRADPDMWIVELDIAEGQQLAARILCAG